MITTDPDKLGGIIKNAVDHHGTRADALIPILLEINQEFGYIPAESILLVRAALHEAEDNTQVSRGQLYGLSSFYQMLSTEKPGRHVVGFCESAPCHVEGGKQVWEALRTMLHLEAGETDEAGRFTLQTVSCVGLCGVGPVIFVDDDIYGNVTPAQLPEILARYH